MSSSIPDPDTRTHQDGLPIVEMEVAPAELAERHDEIEVDGELTEDGAVEGEETGDARWHRRRFKLYCFHCNRYELHYHTLQKKWYFPYLLGFSFGVIHLIGPYRCVCCGHDRITTLNLLHPRTIVRSAMGRQALTGNGESPDK